MGGDWQIGDYGFLTEWMGVTLSERSESRQTQFLLFNPEGRGMRKPSNTFLFPRPEE